MLFAQALADPSSIAGWVTAVASMGTGSAVIYWLLWKHLPGIIADHKAERETKDKLISDLLQRHEDDRNEFKVALNAILDHCKEETDKISQAVIAEMRLLHHRGVLDERSRQGGV